METSRCVFECELIDSPTRWHQHPMDPALDPRHNSRLTDPIHALLPGAANARTAMVGATAGIAIRSKREPDRCIPAVYRSCAWYDPAVLGSSPVSFLPSRLEAAPEGAGCGQR